MKKAVILLIFAICVCMICSACGELTSSSRIQSQTDSMLLSPGSSSMSEASEAIESVLPPSNTSSSHSGSEIYLPWDVDELAMFERLEDIPGPNTYSIDEDKGYLLRDGLPFYGPPGNRYIEPVFVDADVMYICCEWDDGWREWYYFSWDKSKVDEFGPSKYDSFWGVIPDATNLSFVGVDGTLMLTDDGKAFDTGTWTWV